MATRQEIYDRLNSMANLVMEPPPPNMDQMVKDAERAMAEAVQIPSSMFGSELNLPPLKVSMADYQTYRDGKMDLVGLIAKGVSIAPRPIPPLHAPQSSPAIAVTCDAEYEALAEKVGLLCPEVLERKLRSFLHENDYEIFEYQHVCDYMNALMNRLDAERNNRRGSPMGWGDVEYRWFWRPLRAIDKADYAIRGISESREPYDKPVPMPVLQTVAEIAEKLPATQFYVSDYVAVKPDPFLAVKLTGMLKLIVIERWDEPSFR